MPSVPPANLTTNDDGSVDLDVRLHFQNPFDINTTGVGTITVLPDASTDISHPNSAIAQFLPMLGRGDPGLPPEFDQPTLTEVAPGASLPNPNMVRTLVTPGDPFANPPVAPIYHDDIWLHGGPQGLSGVINTLESIGNVVHGALTNGLGLVYRIVDGTGQWTAEPTRVPTFAACTAFTDASGNTPNQTLGSLTLAAQQWSQRPICQGVVQINPATDLTNGYTHIELIARLGNVNTGPIIARGPSLDSASPFLCHLHPTPLAGDSSAVIAANAAGMVYLIAQQTNTTPSSWSTTCANGASFTAVGEPLV